mmetsp:Transcript_7078/g.8190  ORF Transcript_7078/g.8190 Transcript_7078/m.8190 type:complete len:96 (-) Transcript_7078:373-660(-)
MLTFFSWNDTTAPPQNLHFLSNNNKRQQWNQEERKGSKYTCSKFAHNVSSVLSLSFSHISHTHFPSPTPIPLSYSLSDSFHSKQPFLIEERMAVE